MCVKIYSVDNFYTAKLTKILKYSALALSKNITKNNATLYYSTFRRVFPHGMLTTM